MAKMKTREMMAEAAQIPGIVGDMARKVMCQPGFSNWADIMDIVSRITIPFDRSERDSRDKRRSMLKRPLKYPNPRTQKRSLVIAKSTHRRG